jgi:hypothetical protein
MDQAFCLWSRTPMNIQPSTRLFNFIQQKSPTSISGEMNAIVIQFSWGSNPDRIKLKPPADASDFQREFIEQAR